MIGSVNKNSFPLLCKMMSYQNPVGKVPDPYERYRVEESGQRQSNGGPSDEKPPRENQGLLAYFSKFLKRGVDAFLTRIGGTPTQNFREQKALRTLKTSFEILKLEDRSQDVEFLNDLAENWSLAVEQSLEFPESTSQIFTLFVKKILHYPENETHTFGYYLREHAGQKWVPFPYMELVQKIHNEHEKNPSTSALTEWTRLLDDAIRSLSE